jgi:protein SCO1/2
MALTSDDMTMEFRSTLGHKTNLAALGSGRLMLLYFGYTHCPDVCPTTMASLASALQRLPSAEQAQVQVVFVTSDPMRDTPSVLKAWLANFDAELARPFIGLTASAEQIDAAAKTLHILIAPPVKHKNGTVTVDHGAQTIAFKGRHAEVLWSSATAPSDYADDVSHLLGT